MKRLVTLLVSLTVVSSAYGYIDPGTGSYFLQLFAAGIVGVLYGIKTYWSVIKSYFTRKFSK